MRVLLVALNAKYVQTNLALRYLLGAIKNEFPDTVLKETTINEPLVRIAGEIYEIKADVISFSCYIWNITEILRIIRYLRLILPKVRFVLGGPEVTFATQELMFQNPELDAVVRGEGEAAFLELLRTWKAGQDPDNVLGVVWRCQDKIISNPERRPLPELSKLPDPYVVREKLDNRLVYIESTRGCPFNCQYCLSSAESEVRFLEPEQFRRIFRKLLTYGARTIKFVDRTFNTCKDHAFKILDIVREEVQNTDDPQGIRIHCEMAGELLDEEWISYLKQYPQGLLQLEIGVQSTYRPTLESISRLQHFEIWQKYLVELRLTSKIPLHLDLIAGLPGENWDNFRVSFNDVYRVQPQKLQLGFLKVLKGSGLRQKAQQFGLIYQPDPPYTILQTKDLSYTELMQLKRMEVLLNKYYNSGRFIRSLQRVSSFFPSAFDFYDSLARFWHEQNWFGVPWKEKALFERFWLFFEFFRINNPGKIGELKWEALRDALRFDYYCWERPGVIPDFLLPAGEISTENSAVSNKASNVVKPGTFEELKSMVCRKFAQDSEGIPVSRIESMDRQQWSRCTALANFSTPVLNDFEWSELVQLKLNIETSVGESTPTEAEYEVPLPLVEVGVSRLDEEMKQAKPVWYLFFYQRNMVWVFPVGTEDKSQGQSDQGLRSEAEFDY